MSTQINVFEALREAEAGLEVAIQRILKRDPGHAVHVTSEAKALVVVRQVLQGCSGCAVQQGYVPAGQTVRASDNPEHLFEFWWEEHMPEATREKAWTAWVAAPETKDVGIAAVQQGVQPYAVLVFERGEEGPFDRKPVKPGSMQHLHAKRDPHYDYIELYTHPTQQRLDSKALLDVAAERRRQIELGYDHEHDDAHDDESIAAAAAVFIMPEECREWDATSTTYGDTLAEAILPCDWGAPEFGNDRRAQLVKGAAMAIAEIERIDRAASQAKQGELA